MESLPEEVIPNVLDVLTDKYYKVNNLKSSIKESVTHY